MNCQLFSNQYNRYRDGTEIKNFLKCSNNLAKNKCLKLSGVSEAKLRKFSGLLSHDTTVSQIQI